MAALAFASPINALPGIPGIPGPSPIVNKVESVSAPFVSPPKLRKSFPETWIWENVNEDG